MVHGLTERVGTEVIDMTFPEVTFALRRSGSQDALPKLVSFMLANELTLALTGMPDMPNPDGAGLSRACVDPDGDATLGEALLMATLAMATPPVALDDRPGRSRSGPHGNRDDRAVSLESWVERFPTPAVVARRRWTCTASTAPDGARGSVTVAQRRSLIPRVWGPTRA